ncbi:MAG: exopolysaccharide biosynthesis polyprenyl glycosylphosphotransferase, partial [Anaerolineaceae bacterium]|nr:exopolysaccharide biosynthesis polyprenyl glycosylphosphotransferase [Anaerolineaceae bacterium]
PPFYLVGFADDDSEKIGTELMELPVLGGGADLKKMIADHNISDLIFSISGDMQPVMFQALLEAEENGIEVITMPVVYEQLLGRVPISLLQSDWVLRSFVDEAHSSGMYDLGKRLLDIIGAVVGLILMVALLPIIGLATLLDSGWPLFFTQVRTGKNNRPYKIIKFRTMRQDAEKDGIARMATENDDRVTRVGRIMRKSHLDELPQFFNVLKGEMSLVGPRAERPELIEQLQTRIPFYRARLFVKPGLTGWAQVNFHYASTVEDTAVKLEYDLYYIKHRNLLLDFTILTRTVGDVIGFRGQ